MTTKPRALVFLLTLGTIASLLTPNAAAVTWVDVSLDEGIARSSRSGSPVFMLFVADWCGFCHKLERETLSSPVVGEVLLSYVSLRFDVETPRGAEAARRYGVESLPTILVLDAQGTVVDRTTGMISEKDLLTFTDRARLSALSTDGLTRQAREVDGSPETVLRVARALIDRGLEADGMQLLDRIIATGPPGGEAVTGALVSLASQASRRGERKKALALLKQAAAGAGSPDAIRESHTSLIGALRVSGSKADLLGAWEQFASRLPEDPIVQEDFARALLEHGAEPEAALEAADRAISLAPGGWGPRECRAEALSRLRRYHEALETIDEAVRLAPDETSPRVLRLKILEKLRSTR